MSDETIEEFLARGGKIIREEDFVREQQATRKGGTGQKASHVHKWKKVEPGRFRCPDCDAYGHRIETKGWGSAKTKPMIYEEPCWVPSCNAWGTHLRDVGTTNPQPFCPKHATDESALHSRERKQHQTDI